MNKELKLAELYIMDRYSNGSVIVKDKISDSYRVIDIIDKDVLMNEIGSDSNPVTKEDIKEQSLKEIDDRIMAIDEYLNSLGK